MIKRTSFLFLILLTSWHGSLHRGPYAVWGFSLPSSPFHASISSSNGSVGRRKLTPDLRTLTATTSVLFQSSASSSIASVGSTDNNNDSKKGGQSKDDADADSNKKGKSGSLFQFSKRVLASRALLFVGIFLGGYRLGVQTTSAGSTFVNGAIRSARKAPSRFPLAAWLLVLVLFRDVWRLVPAWLKPRLLQRAASDTQVLFGMKTREQADEELSQSSTKNKDDLSDFTTLFGKLGTIRSVLQSRLPYDEDGKPLFNLQASFFALLKATRDIKSARIGKRDDFYAKSGRPATMEDMEQLDDLMEYADWAYDEADKPLKELLDDKGYILLKHDQTTVPGYLGHYVAIPRDKFNKVALIGVKGTSGLEDMITDMCGAAVDVELERPYYKYAEEKTSTNLRAHEGIMIGTRRLAEDLKPFVENLLLPQGYRIVIVGHSLGAAAAALLGVLLRSQIPDLQQYDTQEGPSNKSMQIYAFASPPSLDLDNALITIPFITTIVNNCDIITRCNASPLRATVDVMQAVNDKLESAKSVKQKVKRSWRFWRNGAKATAEEVEYDDEAPTRALEADAEELMKAIANATEAITKNGDEDHLYVPGKVILMYDEWSQHTDETKENRSEGKDSTAFTNHVADKAIICKGTAQPLQYIEFDPRLLEDHMTEDYKASIAKVMSSMHNNTAMIP